MTSKRTSHRFASAERRVLTETVGIAASDGIAVSVECSRGVVGAIHSGPNHSIPELVAVLYRLGVLTGGDDGRLNSHGWRC